MNHLFSNIASVSEASAGNIEKMLQQHQRRSINKCLELMKLTEQLQKE